MELEADALHAADVAATLVARRFKGFVDQDDLYMDGVEWLLRHSPRIEHCRFDDGTIHITQLASEVGQYLSKIARAWKMSRFGMDPRDQIRYTRKSVEAALPAVWDRDYRPTAAEGSRGRTDPSTRGSWEATAMDMRRAVTAVCTQEDERVLFAVYALGGSARESSFYAKTPRDQIAPRAHRVVTQIMDFLNQEYTLQIEELEQEQEARHAMSNAQARAIQDNQYGGA